MFIICKVGVSNSEEKLHVWSLGLTKKTGDL